MVEIDSILFNENANHTQLDSIFNLFIEGRFDAYITDYSIEKSEWYEGARRDKKLFFKELLTKSVNHRPAITITENNDLDKKQFSLKDGTIYLKTKVLIFLENSYNDERFIRSLLSNFKIGHKARNFLKNNWLVIKNGGGSGLKNQIYAEIRKFRGDELSNHEYIRAIVIIDSDKKHPQHVVDKSEIIDVCAELGIKLHILNKREMENYLPVDILDLDPNTPENIIDALRRLSPVQLDHYDLEKGFDVQSPNQMAAKYSDLYEGVSREDYNILKLGFRNTEFKTKSQVPPLFLKNELTGKMILDRCAHQSNPNELTDLAEEINELL